MVTVERTFHCPPHAVLDVLADGWTYAIWVVGTSRIRAVDASWPSPGSQIAHSAGLWPVLLDDTTVCRRWDPSGRIELQARGWPLGEARVVLEVVPRPGGTCTVRISEDAVRGPGTLVPKPIRSAVIGSRNTETLRRLQMLAEGRHGRHTSAAEGSPDG
ncbi:SRPBCC family protein [Cellulomonas fimi]|uniref:SRPBCC family protein n=1 Tax=Cellulomonas fimi TaxID=1708 RepID=A0A7Y0M0R0_CELFI|nr:SRPBCC family protein [Cellulomonas fimi]NMR21289.1 SRPBCC family protein [Cellulomonas fimi]